MSKFPDSGPLSMDTIRTAFNLTGTVSITNFGGRTLWDTNGNQLTVPTAGPGTSLDINYFLGKYYTNPISFSYYVINKGPLNVRYRSFDEKTFFGDGIDGQLGWRIWFIVKSVGGSMQTITNVKFWITEKNADGRGGASCDVSDYYWNMKSTDGSINVSGNNDSNTFGYEQTGLSSSSITFAGSGTNTGAHMYVATSSAVPNVDLYVFLESNLTIVASNPTQYAQSITQTQYANNYNP